LKKAFRQTDSGRSVYMNKIPVIDLFAGPGGLGEGFSTYVNGPGDHPFKLVLSIEKDYFAYQTLRLRSFLREFDEDIPPEYYQCLRGELHWDELFELFPGKASRASDIAWRAELGVTKHREVDQRIKKAIHDSPTWILMGGPPCQAYSIVGRSRMARIWEERPEEKEKDRRHFLYREYLRIIKKHKPPVFVMENVRGILSSQISDGRIFDIIIDDLHNLGYRLYSFVKHSGNETGINNPEDFIIRCEKYGIPQARHRVIIFGVSKKVKAAPKFLAPQPETIRLNSVIGDLPKIRSGLSKTTDTIDSWIAALRKFNSKVICDLDTSIKREIDEQLDGIPRMFGRGGEYVESTCSGPEFERGWFHDPQLKGVCNHSSRGHIIADLHRYLFASCFAKVMKRSPRLSDFPKHLLPKHQNVTEGIQGKFADRFRVQLADTPATTITSHISKDGHYFIHPDPSQCRSLTVREAARIQTFPDNYLFLGPRTSQYTQVGNAVPPLLAKRLAGKVYELLEDANLTGL